jgi:hypothetical protein
MLLRSTPLADTEVLVIDDPVVSLTCAVVTARFLVSCGLFTPNALEALPTFYSHWYTGARSVQQVTLPRQHEALQGGGGGWRPCTLRESSLPLVFSFNLAVSSGGRGV